MPGVVSTAVCLGESSLFRIFSKYSTEDIIILCVLIHCLKFKSIPTAMIYRV